MDNEPVVENMIQELRRGVIVLAVLSLLQEELYGYSILKRLSDQCLEVDQGTLYPLLRRLETQGMLESKWQLEEARPRRYYLLTAEGRRVLPLLASEWEKITSQMNTILAK